MSAVKAKMKTGSWLIAAILSALSLSGLMLAGAAQAQAGPRITLLTYNVKGLPWPVASDRSAALDAIAGRLAAMRRKGQQPNLVALQEAFIPEAKAIGRKAGYRYVAFGPGSDEVSVSAGTPQDRAFRDAARFMDGESSGKRVDSGLVIFSDYPIVAVHRTAYAVCAGYDCLANKGALAVAVVVPGLAAPLTVINSHLNSGAASGAPRERATYAYRRQVDALKLFIASTCPPGLPILIAGDFNVGNRAERRNYFTDQILGISGLLVAERACGQKFVCSGGTSGGIAESIRHGKDWLLYRPSRSLALWPVNLSASFGRAPDGSMLSDHIGVAVTYAFDRLTGPGPRDLEIAIR
ncbi:endonuclease/exonuclease/phosphatase family protein [Sphingosinicellaceae bacterium]|nr:endonuclease/exonuclease/phosphatase family protein [Sphingosinicellaceae bacterium]